MKIECGLNVSTKILYIEASVKRFHDDYYNLLEYIFFCVDFSIKQTRNIVGIHKKVLLKVNQV